jgi:antitoxin VapB
MSQTAKVFKTGRSQAVRLPASFRFASEEVYIRKDPDTGDVILSAKPGNWRAMFAAIDADTSPPDDFMRHARDQAPERGDVL